MTEARRIQESRWKIRHPGTAWQGWESDRKRFFTVFPKGINGSGGGNYLSEKGGGAYNSGVNGPGNCIDQQENPGNLFAAGENGEGQHGTAEDRQQLQKIGSVPLGNESGRRYNSQNAQAHIQAAEQ